MTREEDDKRFYNDILSNILLESESLDDMNEVLENKLLILNTYLIEKGYNHLEKHMIGQKNFDDMEIEYTQENINIRPFLDYLLGEKSTNNVIVNNIDMRAKK